MEHAGDTLVNHLLLNLPMSSNQVKTQSLLNALCTCSHEHHLLFPLHSKHIGNTESLLPFFVGIIECLLSQKKKAYFSESFLLSSKFVFNPSMRNLHGTVTCPLRPRIARPVQPALLARNFYLDWDNRSLRVQLSLLAHYKCTYICKGT